MIKLKNLLKNFRDFLFCDKLTIYLSKKINKNVCIDLGAALFEHISWKTFLLSKNTKWVAVDPNKKNLEYLKSWRWPANLIIKNQAISKNGGLMNFYLTNTKTGSSLKKIKIQESMISRIDKNYFFPIKKIKLKTISSKKLISNYSKEKFDIFIKIDIQGYGLDILKGLSEYINKKEIIGIEIESSLYADPVYKNSSKFNEVSRFLENKGYELIDIKIINLKKNSYKKRYLPNECDAVFALKQDQFKKKNIQSKINLIGFYNCYKLYQEIKNFYFKNKDLHNHINSKIIEKLN